ncbi:MAG: SGNH/GDSL hydrolase family protein [Candidatus Latescibacterota bacterium]|nr:SGNH/GDSL hydrolase family protein [Candidatus Latescibacterota bacterium]
MQKVKVILAVVSLVAGVLLCELALHFLHPQVFRRPEVWRYDPDLGWSHIPGSSGRLVSPEFDVEMRINTAGLRDREFATVKGVGIRRLALFGDSFVEGWGVAVEAVVSRQLETCLRGRGKQVEVANFGVAGYGTDQALLFFEQRGLHFGPGEVLLFFYGNDLWNNAARKGIGAERGFKPYFRLRQDGQLRLQGVPVPQSGFWNRDEMAVPIPLQLERYFSRHWHVFKLVQKAFQPEVERGQQQAFYEGLYGVDESRRFAPAWALTGRLLAAFKKSVERHGARLTVVYVPSIVQVEDDNWQAKRELHGLVGDFDLRKPNKQLARFADRYDLRVVDLYDEFADRARTETLYLRDSHWNRAGHALAAQRLCATLAGVGP